MIMHAFKDYHFLELQDDNGVIVRYTAIELFDHLMDMDSTNSKNILYWFLKLDVRASKQLNQTYKTWKKFKTRFTKAINDNKSNTGTLKAILIANTVKVQVDQNKENQRVLAQATMEANAKIDVVGTQTTRWTRDPGVGDNSRLVKTQWFNSTTTTTSWICAHHTWCETTRWKCTHCTHHPAFLESWWCVYVYVYVYLVLLVEKGREEYTVVIRSFIYQH